MNVNEILTFIAQVFFIVLSAIALFDYILHPDPRRRDFALLSAALGIPLGTTFITKVFGYHSGLLDLLGAFILFAQPYFLFRLLQYFRPSPRWLRWVILLGMVACWVLIFLIARYPATIQVLVFGYTVVVDAFCTWQYYLGMQATAGTLRRRILLITVSAGLFTLALAGNVLKAVMPSAGPVAGGIGLAITAISAILYYIAFIPPSWMRHAWQYEDLRNFLARGTPNDPPPNVSTATAGKAGFADLAHAANYAVNGMLAAVVQRTDPKMTERTDTDPDGAALAQAAPRQWEVLATNNSELATAALDAGASVLDAVWQKQAPVWIDVPKCKDADKRRALAQVGARTWLIVPIAAASRTWGLLLVLLQHRSLFIDDDLALLELFAQQSAMVQENRHLIAELQQYSEQLERKVEERTRELQESESALRELNATLEQRVDQRTAELQRSNEELDNFAYVASHDLKAPLRAINHLAGWVEEDAGHLLPEATREHLSKLQGRVQRMETLLNDLLAYSRVGRQRHPPEAVHIQELISDITDMLSPPAGFVVETYGDLTMYVERTPLETVFRNLISNAIKHHDHVQNGCVKVHACEKEGVLEFTVTDDGPGIAPEFHERVFDIFTTLHPRDQVEGSGIGLAIVKKSVESRGGSVGIESEPGRGTSIRFTWPQNGHA